ncbi:MAG: TenA family protein [Alphaproteobacteria bacterium]
MHLKSGCPAEWRAYTGHEFVRQLGAGRLPEACFRRYLVQDYLFLIQFARAYGLAAYKSDTLREMRQAAATLSALLDTEMSLHVEYCRGWGLTESAMAAAPEEPETMAYTRYVLEAGLSGDLLDLLAALAPCVVGYAEIGRALLGAPTTRLRGNPYRSWIEMYAGEAYGAVADAAIEQLDRVAAERLGARPWARHPRADTLRSTFREATRLEADFWSMGLRPRQR